MARSGAQNPHKEDIEPEDITRLVMDLLRQTADRRISYIPDGPPEEKEDIESI